MSLCLDESVPPIVMLLKLVFVVNPGVNTGTGGIKAFIPKPLPSTT